MDAPIDVYCTGCNARAATTLAEWGDAVDTDNPDIPVCAACGQAGTLTVDAGAVNGD